MAEIDPWVGDLLKRRPDGEHLKQVLLDRYRQRKENGEPASYILNIDAGWGEGKSFFLAALRKSVSADGHLTAFVNAWTDDISDDPLTTVMLSIDEGLGPLAAKDPNASSKYRSAKEKLGAAALEIGKQVGAHALRKALGISLDSVKSAMDFASIPGSDDKLIDGITEEASKAADKFIDGRILSMKVARSSLSDFKTRIAETLALIHGDNIPEPMIVFIDELDRCRPSYAISLLEEMKHLFDIDGMVFVIATDSEQLSHSVKAVYGEGFDGRRYLRRFFDRVFVFPDSNTTDFVANALEKRGVRQDIFFDVYNQHSPQVIAGWLNAFSLSHRDFEQCCEVISAVVTSWRHKVRIEPIYLLTLVWAAYTSQWDLFGRISNFDMTDLTQLHKWTFNRTVRHYANEPAKMESISAANILSNGSDIITKTVDLAHSFSNPYWKFVGDTEFQQLHNSSFNSLQGPPYSVIKEYSSRVRNAGRLIELI